MQYIGIIVSYTLFDKKVSRDDDKYIINKDLVLFNCEIENLLLHVGDHLDSNPNNTCTFCI